MYIQRSISKGKNGKEYISHLLCHKYREEGKIKTRILSNLSQLPEHLILGIENMLKSPKETVVSLKDISVSSCSDYGYVSLIIRLMNKLRINEVLEKTLPDSEVDMIKAMITGKLCTGSSKLGIFNWLNREPDVTSILGLDMKGKKIDDFYKSLGKLSVYQDKIERKWFLYNKGAKKRVYLYDLTSSYFEGTENELAAFGYNRDKKTGKMQICIGLLTDEKGFPLKIQVFKGNTQDACTVTEQIEALKKSFGAEEIIFVGDRGMHIMYHIENEEILSKENIGFITGLTRCQIESLMEQGHIQLSLFSKDLAEVEFDEKRYVLSVNPDLEQKELQWLDFHKEMCDSRIEDIKASWLKRNLLNAENIKKQIELKSRKSKTRNLKTSFSDKDIEGYKHRVNKVFEKYKMNKYYKIEKIDNENFEVTFDEDAFVQSRSLCGKYVLCSNVKSSVMNKEEIRGQYKNLQKVEHDFRDLKSDNISIRPVYHRKKEQTGGHVLICMFALAIIKEMENIIYPFLENYNKLNKTQLSFNDIIEELKKVKICKLKIGKNLLDTQISELNNMQNKIFNLFDMDINKKIV